MSGRGRFVAGKLGRFAVTELVKTVRRDDEGLAGTDRSTGTDEVGGRMPGVGEMPGHGVEVRRAKEFRQLLEDLGPFYIKVGQILSTRPDVVSDVMMKELGTLHDRVGIAPFAAFEPTLEQDLGRRWRRGFREFDVAQPIGTASLAQVYWAKLADGTPVAVKVQRPGIRPVIRQDMAILRRTARLFGRCAPRLNAVIDIDAMLGVIFEAMQAELDFGIEAANMDRMRGLVNTFQYLAIPEVVHATPHVLIQGMAPGVSIRDADRDKFSEEERKAIGRDLLAFMYHSYFIEGMFHADPHPGNIFVHPGEKAWLIDWGMMGRLDRNMSMALMSMLSCVAQNDAVGFANGWIELGKATSWADIPAFMASMATLVPRVTSASLESLNFGLTLTEVLKNSSRHGIRSSPMVGLLGKSFANIEGSVRYLTPELVIAEVFEEELTDIMIQLAGQMLSQAQAARAAMQLMLGAANLPEQVRGIVRALANNELTTRVHNTTAARVPGRWGMPAAFALGLGVAAWLTRKRSDR